MTIDSNLIPFNLTIQFSGISFSFQYQDNSTADEQNRYGEAGEIADYTFSFIRTVVTFGGENREIKK